MRCVYREVKTECGQYLDVDIYPVMQTARIHSKRGKRYKPTPETMARYNQRNRETKLERLVLANFADGTGLFFNPTYDTEHYPADDEQAKRDIRNFLRRLKDWRKKHDLPELKYIVKTERGKRSGRLHHHLILNCADMRMFELEQIWGKGFTFTSVIYCDSEGCPGLARYFCKNKKAKLSEEMDDLGEDVGNAWSRSRNLIEPKVTKRDGRISRQQAIEICKLADSAKDMIERLYPGYELGALRSLYNEINGGYYTAIRLCKHSERKRGRR